MQNTFLRHNLPTPLKPAIGLNKKMWHSQNSVCNGYEEERIELQSQNPILWQYLATQELAIATVCNMETHHLFSTFCSRALRSWGFNPLTRNNQHAHKLCTFWLKMDCLFAIFAKSSGLHRKRKVEGEGRHNNCLKLEYSVTLRRWLKGKGFGGGRSVTQLS